VARISLKGIKKRFKTTDVLFGIDLEIGDREFVVFVGPSGCGKSTLLRLIAGLDPITEGTFHLNDRLMNPVAPSKRGIAMVFQSYALYPHMDVYENMAFGARLMGLTKDEVEARIGEAARMLRLEELLKRRPRELSGGQRQRVAIGRALVRKPEVLLLDEPLSNLDAALRSDVRLEIARLHRAIGGTTIYVTHDQVEAMTLADRIVVLNAGRIEQVGSPRALYETPANTFVATFIGSPRMSLVTARRDGARLVLPGAGTLDLTAPGDDATVTIGFRPDALSLRPGAPGDGPGLSGHIVYTEYLGDNAFAYVRLDDGTLVPIKIAPGISLAPDAPVAVDVQPGGAHFFSAHDGRRLQ
jgi:multiple sugar transport system ATP-binding protein